MKQPTLKNKRERTFSVTALIGLTIYLLASPGFYLQLAVTWFDMTNIFNSAYDRQALGLTLSSDAADPLYVVMRIVSVIGFIVLLVGIIGTIATRLYSKDR